MNPKALAKRWGLIAAAMVACSSPWSSSSAEEPAANEQKQERTNTTSSVSVSTDLASTSSTRLALDTLFVAANSDLIGADVAQVDDVLRSHLGLGEGKGLVVTSVADGGPAAKAGLRKNDVLVTVGGEEIAGPDALRKSLEASTDKPIGMGFIRGGKKQSVEVIPESATSQVFLELDTLEPVYVNQLIAEPKYWLGVGLASADDTLRAQLALPAGQGLVVTGVENESPAAKAGVMVNDVLLKLDGKALTTIEALSEQLQTIADKSVSLELLRRGKPATLTVIPEKHAEAWQTMAIKLAPDVDVSFVAPQRVAITSSAWTFDVAGFTHARAKPDLIRQLDELAAQVKQLEQLDELAARVKQLEASLAALREVIDAPSPPAQTDGEKKEAK